MLLEIGEESVSTALASGAAEPQSRMHMRRIAQVHAGVVHTESAPV